MAVNVVFSYKNVEEGFIMDNNWNTNENQGQFSGQTVEQTEQNTTQSNIYQTYQQYQPYQQVQPPVADETVRISEYLLPLLLCQFIPCAGVILMIVYAFSDKEKESKKNFCKAWLISFLISLVLSIILLIVYVVIFAAAIG